jgi:hypothetical protein
LLKSTSYWLVLKFVGAADNGDNLVVNFGAVASTTTKTRLNDASAWTVFATGRMVTTLTYYQASYIDTITLPATVVDVTEMHTGDETDRPVSLLPYSNDRFIASGNDLPADTFCVRKVSGNCLTLYHNSGTASLSYTCECQLFPTAVTADTDTMLVPDAGIDYIIYMSAAILGNNGALDEATIAEYRATANVVKENMEFRYISKTQGRRVERSGFTRGGIQQTAWLKRRNNVER